MTMPTCQEKWSLLVFVDCTHSSPVVQEQLGHELVTSLTRQVEGSLLVVAQGIHRSSAAQKQTGHGFVTMPTCQQEWSLHVLVDSTHSSPRGSGAAGQRARDPIYTPSGAAVC